MAPPQLSLADFERCLLRGDAPALQAAGLAEAASVARGHVDPFIPPPTPPIQLPASSAPLSSPAVQLAHELATQCATCEHALSPRLSLALATASPPAALQDAYVAAVALFTAFVRDNWAGPTRPPVVPDDAALFLAVDGELVARPAVSAHLLRAARVVFVQHAAQLAAAGARLAPWWAARVVVAHQVVLSAPAPSLRAEALCFFARFLGVRRVPDAATVATASLGDVAAGDDDDDDEGLLPAPMAAHDHDMRDVDAEFVEVLSDSAADAELLALALLELTQAQHGFYDADAALDSLRAASRAAAVALRVRGELGMRTKHQAKATAQLVARSFAPADFDAPRVDAESLAFLFPTSAGDAAYGGARATSDVRARLPFPKNVEVNDTDVLGYVKLADSNGSARHADDGEHRDGDDDDDDDLTLDTGPVGLELEFLTPLQQLVALAHANIVSARNALHKLTDVQMAPFVDLVLRNAHSPHGSSSVVQIRALLLRVSFERDRGRYLERCMSQMEEIARFIDDAMETAEPDVRALATVERVSLTLASALPPKWEIMKELAISFGKIGLIKSAMETFERLEFWDELVDCHRLIGNLGRAEALVREHLELLDAAALQERRDAEAGRGKLSSLAAADRAAKERAMRRPRLLCVLGEVTRDRSHFETAWTESGGRFARAKRALARMCVEKEEWEEAVEHFREALQMNPLFPDAWFTYGCASMETGNMQLAANAFTSVVQQTPRNGEAWNNLGRVLYELGKKKEALNALTEAGKLKRDSWRIWNNVVLLATELRSSLDIVRGMERLVELRGKDGVIAPALGVAVDEVIRMSGSNDVEDKSLVGPVSKRLLKLLGRCTSVVSTNPAVWAAYAQLHEVAGASDGMRQAFQCRLKQVRSLTALSSWKREKAVFRHMAVTCDALTRTAIEGGEADNMRAARLQVESVIAQTVEDFKDDDGFIRLQEVLARLETRALTKDEQVECR